MCPQDISTLSEAKVTRQVNNLVLLSVALVVSIVCCSSSGEAPGGPTSRMDDANSEGESPALADVIDVQVYRRRHELPLCRHHIESRQRV